MTEEKKDVNVANEEVKTESLVKPFEGFDSKITISAGPNTEPLVELDLANGQVNLGEGISKDTAAAALWSNVIKTHSNVVIYFDWNARAALSVIHHLVEKEPKLKDKLAPAINSLSSIIRVMADYKLVEDVSVNIGNIRKSVAEKPEDVNTTQEEKIIV